MGLDRRKRAIIAHHSVAHTRTSLPPQVIAWTQSAVTGGDAKKNLRAQIRPPTSGLFSKFQCFFAKFLTWVGEWGGGSGLGMAPK